MKEKSAFFVLPSIVTLLIALSGCKKNDNSEPLTLIPKDSIQSINKWILDSMRHYYYWAEELSSVKSLEGEPAMFFSNLLNQDDRFSWISDGGQVKSPQNSFTQFGFHYLLVLLPEYSSSRLLGVVTLSQPESAASNAGVYRGMYFSQVNGVEITADNIKSITEKLDNTSAVEITVVKNNQGEWVEGKVIKIKKAYYEDVSVLMVKVFDVLGKRTGYILYNSFNEYSDSYLVEAFEKLKAKKISEIILDMRYNQGGSVSSAAKLCALLSKVKEEDLFGIYEGNKVLGEYPQTFKNEISNSISSAGRDFKEINEVRSPLNRVFILSGSLTSSAAEMTINNLKPYLSVIQIGEKTFGKDMAGTLVRDKRNPRVINWYMQPMVFKLYNAAGGGEYPTGISPDYLVNEIEDLPLSMPGSSKDPLIAKALTLIYGTYDVQEEILRKKQVKFNLLKKNILFNSLSESGSVTPLVSIRHLK